MRTLMRWTLLTAAAAVIAMGLLVVPGLYLLSPEHQVRIQSGPPPLFIWQTSVGTGFFVNSRGDIATNRHVVQGCHRIAIAGQGFHAQPATLRALPADPATDLALLHTNVAVPASLSLSDSPWPGADSPQPDLTPAIRTAILADANRNAASARLIGFPGWFTGEAPTISAVQITETAITNDHRHYVRPVTGTFMQGSSGSPIVNNRNVAAGVLVAFTFTIDSKTKRPLPGEEPAITPNGMSGHRGLMIPASILAAFAKEAGVAVSIHSEDVSNSSPASAVIRIFCFHTWL